MLAAFAGIAVGTVAFVYVYGISFIARDWMFLAGARADLANAEVVRRNLNGAEQRIAALAPEVAATRASFADPQDPLPFIEAVELLGRRLGVKVELTLASAAAADPADAYRVAVSGPFPQVAAFLRMLGSFPFLITTGDVELKRTGAITEMSDPSRDSVRLSVAMKFVLP